MNAELDRKVRKLIAAQSLAIGIVDQSRPELSRRGHYDLLVVEWNDEIEEVVRELVRLPLKGLRDIVIRPVVGTKFEVPVNSDLDAALDIFRDRLETLASKASDLRHDHLHQDEDHVVSGVVSGADRHVSQHQADVDPITRITRRLRFFTHFRPLAPFMSGRGA